MTAQYLTRSRTNARENNEDSFLVFTLGPANEQPIPVLALADGMGGHDHGENISQEGLRKVALSLFEELCVAPALNRTSPPPPTADALAETLWTAIQQANHHVRRMIELNKWAKAGSTIVLAAILGYKLIVANLGDSPAFLYRADRDELIKLTTDHTIAGALLRANMISEDMARHHEGRSRLEFFLGADSLPRTIPLRRVALSPGDLILLCSDGVSGSLSAGQIKTALAASPASLPAAADRLLQLALDAGETDNQTLILWRHTGPPPDDLAAQPTMQFNATPSSDRPTEPSRR